MKRHRIDISPQAKSMLKEIGEALGVNTFRYSLLAEICIQSAYENIINQDSLDKEVTPINQTQIKLDEILSLLKELLPEV